MSDVVPGLYQVELDLSSFAPSVNVLQVEDGVYDDDMLRLLSGVEDDACLFSLSPVAAPVYFLYVVTPPEKAAEYVLRLPYFVSDTCFLSLADCTLTGPPIWYTFSTTQSIVCVSFTTSSPPLLVESGLRDFAAWVDMCTSWCMTYSHLFAPTFSPNIASILCTTQSVLVVDHDREGPTWLPHDGEGVTLFQHSLQVTPPPPCHATPDWVRHMSTHLDVYALHARFTRLERYHVEPRRPTPLPSSPLSALAPPPSTNTLHPGDWVVYLTPNTDGFEFAQVLTVSPAVTLDTDVTPPFVAKFDPAQHSLVSDLRPLQSFVIHA